MQILVKLVIGCMLLQCVWHIFRTLIVKKKIDMDKSSVANVNENQTEKTTFYIVIPCLQEQKIIGGTIDYFVKIISNSSINAKLFIVTTDKEKRLVKYGKTTFDTVKEKIITSDSYNCVKLLNYPQSEGMMADQLNYAFNKIAHTNIVGKQDYFCVYNADSRPGQNILFQARKTILKKHFPLIMQEYSAFFSNLRSLSPIMKGFAVYQTNFELINGLTNAILPSIFLRNHVVGHGLFVRFDYLKRIGGFSTRFWCEDIYLSFYLRSQGVIVEPLFSLEYGETPKNLRILTKQNANWFKTLADTKKIYRTIRSENKNIRKLNTLLYYLNQIRGAIAWIFLPSFYLFIFIFLVINDIKYALGFATIYFITTSVRFFLSNIIAKSLHGLLLENNFLLSVEGSIAYLLSNIGPLYSIFHRKSTKYKTER